MGDALGGSNPFGPYTLQLSLAYAKLVSASTSKARAISSLAHSPWLSQMLQWLLFALER